MSIPASLMMATAVRTSIPSSWQQQRRDIYQKLN
jgi:hypothetical protein